MRILLYLSFLFLFLSCEGELTVTNGSGSGIYEYGMGAATNVPIKAESAEAGLKFYRWEGPSSSYVLDLYVDETTIRIARKSMSIEATFIDENESYNVEVTSGSGSEDNIFPGKLITIKANPPELNMLFDRWAGDTNSFQSNYDVTKGEVKFHMPRKDVKLEATYREKDKYAVTVVNGDGSGKYFEGDLVTVEGISPGIDYYFKGWIGDSYLVEDKTLLKQTFTMPSKNVALEADFKLPYDGPECLYGAFNGSTGTVKQHEIPIEFNGRPTIGDLTGDGHSDFVMSSRNRVAAYDVCGKKLWDIAVNTNWDYSRHYFWNYTTYGYVGDADGDGKAEFLHIGSDWKTLYIRDGKTGAIKSTIALPTNEQWMYVLLARRNGETGDSATRIITTSAGYDSSVSIASIDIRNSPKYDWVYTRDTSHAGNSVYVSPQAANLDAIGGDEIFFGGIALNENGQLIWLADTNGTTANRGLHAATVKDIDPSSPGLEAVFSLYSPGSGPSMVAFAAATGNRTYWGANSPHAEKHPHQHAVGDFDPNSPGLETIARNNNGYNHWIVNSKGQNLINNFRVNPYWQGDGDYVRDIEWDEKKGTEVLFVERHVKPEGSRARRPRFTIASPVTNTTIAPVFGGGVVEDARSWMGVGSSVYTSAPYESAALTVDLIGDGREEILTWGGNKFTIFYNSGDAGVKKRWGNSDYEIFKKISCPLYSPR